MTPLIFPDKNILVVTSDAQIMEIYLSNYINNMLKKPEIKYIAHPYIITNQNDMDDFNNIQKINSDFLKLCLLNHMKWVKSSSKQNNELYRFLLKLNENELNILYKHSIEFGKTLLNCPNITIENLLNKTCDIFNIIYDLKYKNDTNYLM